MSNSTRPSNSTTSTTSYDECFVVPLEASRRGAHRARVSPVMAVLPIAAVVGIVIGAIALVYLFLGGTGDNAATTATSLPPTAAALTKGPSTTPSASAATGSPSATASDATSQGVVDRTVTVNVFNGSNPSVSGLARKASTKLSAAGWTLGQVATWTGAPVTGTTVYYGTETQRATALAIARSLGHGVAKLSSTRAANGITVVVGNDFTGTATRATGTVARPSAGRTTTPKSSAAAASGTHAPTRSPAAATTQPTG